MIGNDAKLCNSCGTTLTRVINAIALSESEWDAIRTGLAIATPRKPGVPDAVCLNCFNRWREVNALTVQDRNLQIKKEVAVTASDFEVAMTLLNEQRTIRPQLEALLERLIRST